MMDEGSTTKAPRHKVARNQTKAEARGEKLERRARVRSQEPKGKGQSGGDREGSRGRGFQEPRNLVAESGQFRSQESDIRMQKYGWGS